MKSKNKLFLTFILLLLLVNGYYYIVPLFISSDKNLEHEIAEMVLTSNDLVKSYNKDEKKSNALYAGKIIEITGFVEKVSFLNNRNTIILKSNTENFGVICDVHPNDFENLKELKENQKIRVKGICKGFLKDVILLNCSIDLKPNE
ncbi:OB-fold protein [Polaribacter ponticola]|uniref:tRNA_anti-like n=1 Tax=Polaribacter ponticola TaxID=2978475 RepID=A0ABT5S6U8_9FLAO|nr:hypothetical protein [Polaribacter sp. MSW5]MDD7913082.1 hypothetical protein [Polaribacter sp. MSW5]